MLRSESGAQQMSMQQRLDDPLWSVDACGHPQHLSSDVRVDHATLNEVCRLEGFARVVDCGFENDSSLVISASSPNP